MPVYSAGFGNDCQDFYKRKCSGCELNWQYFISFIFQQIFSFESWMDAQQRGYLIASLIQVGNAFLLLPIDFLSRN